MRMRKIHEETPLINLGEISSRISQLLILQRESGELTQAQCEHLRSLQVAILDLESENKKEMAKSYQSLTRRTCLDPHVQIENNRVRFQRVQDAFDHLARRTAEWLQQRINPEVNRCLSTLSSVKKMNPAQKQLHGIYTLFLELGAILSDGLSARQHMSRIYKLADQLGLSYHPYWQAADPFVGFNKQQTRRGLILTASRGMCFGHTLNWSRALSLGMAPGVPLFTSKVYQDQFNQAVFNAPKAQVAVQRFEKAQIDHTIIDRLFTELQTEYSYCLSIETNRVEIKTLFRRQQDGFAHAMGLRRIPGTSLIEFFDPNFGSFVGRESKMKEWLSQHLAMHYTGYSSDLVLTKLHRQYAATVGCEMNRPLPVQPDYIQDQLDCSFAVECFVSSPAFFQPADAETRVSRTLSSEFIPDMDGYVEAGDTQEDDLPEMVIPTTEVDNRSQAPVAQTVPEEVMEEIPDMETFASDDNLLRPRG